MTAALRIARYELHDVIRSRWLFGYAGFFAIASDALLRFSGDPSKALLSLSSLVLLVIPLVTIIFGTVYVYGAREFTELLLAQPVSRRDMYAGLYLGLAVPLSGGFAAGAGVPLLLHTGGAERGIALTMLAAGVALTFAFTAIAFVIALHFEDRLRGLGAAVAVWVLCALVYDAAVLFLVTAFADYPLERPLLGVMLANPIDLARIVLLLRFDVSALMGYTGAVFKQFFGSGLGVAVATTALLAWIAGPVALGARTFRRKDF